MKKIITLLSLIVLTTIIAQAQSFKPLTLTAQKADLTACTKDTTVNTDTSYLVTGLITSYSDLEFNIVNTKLTGTSGGTIIVQGSPDNSNWYTMVNDKTQSLINDTTTVSNTTRFQFVVKTHPYQYYRIRYISSGTQTSVMTGLVYIKQHN